LCFEGNGQGKVKSLRRIQVFLPYQKIFTCLRRKVESFAINMYVGIEKKKRLVVSVIRHSEDVIVRAGIDDDSNGLFFIASKKIEYLAGSFPGRLKRTIL